MDKQLQEFFYSEQGRGCLDYDADPEYSDLLNQSEALFPDGELPKPLFDLLETANCIAFVHGLKLGLELRRWAAGASPRPTQSGV